MTESLLRGERQAALLLHSLSQGDRHWLLGQLGDAQRKRLSDLLEELGMLGIPKDPSLIKEVTSSLPSAASDAAGIQEKLLTSGVTDAFEHNVAMIAAADAGTLVELLRAEPVMLVAKLMRVYAWPWQQSFLGQLDISKRRQIEEILKRMPEGQGTAYPVIERSMNPDARFQDRFSEKLLSILCSRLERYAAADTSQAHKPIADSAYRTGIKKMWGVIGRFRRKQTYASCSRQI